jgi:hypothetical protein
MRRSLPTAAVVIVGLLLLIDFVVVNPTLAGLAGLLILWIVLLAAAAAVTGTIALGARHVTDLVHRRGDRIGSILVLVGIGLMCVAGFYPGSAGATDPLVRWLVGALLAPLVASIFALLFIFMLGAMRRGLRLRARDDRHARRGGRRARAAAAPGRHRRVTPERDGRLAARRADRGRLPRDADRDRDRHGGHGRPPAAGGRRIAG